MSFLHGDDRFYNNIFVQKPLRDSIKALEARKADEPDEWDDYNFKVGSQVFNDYPVYEEWIKQFEGYQNIYAPNNDRYYRSEERRVGKECRIGRASVHR